MNVFGQRQHPEKFIPMCINAFVMVRLSLFIVMNLKLSWSTSLHPREDVSDALLFLLAQDTVVEKETMVEQSAPSSILLVLKN